MVFYMFGNGIFKIAQNHLQKSAMLMIWEFLVVIVCPILKIVNILLVTFKILCHTGMEVQKMSPQLFGNVLTISK